MTKKRKYVPRDPDDASLGSEPYREWTKEELASVKAYAKEHHAKRTPEQIISNALMGTKYQMLEYLEDETITEKTMLSIEHFIDLFLEATNLTLKKFATAIDTTDANLKKYLNGQRTFNVDLALKFANFFHTKPDLWLRVQLKNDLLQLNSDKNMMRQYKVYDYKPVVRLVREEKALYKKKKQSKPDKKH
ncbi:MAG: helix-turn-helix domain-containing protein [Bacteroidia bacterium]|nr:helix-turn-helix domain-containing protein [Bacteroidia bacterium]